MRVIYDEAARLPESIPLVIREDMWRCKSPMSYELETRNGSGVSVDPILLIVLQDPPPYGERMVGEMWRDSSGDIPGRECWWIKLPNSKPSGPGYASEITWRTTDRASSPPHELWEVTGEPPYITVSPSIDVECWVNRNGVSVREGSYFHGWIKDGFITIVL